MRSKEKKASDLGKIHMLLAIVWYFILSKKHIKLQYILAARWSSYFPDDTTYENGPLYHWNLIKITTAISRK
jgi:hypothetical protein